MDVKHATLQKQPCFLSLSPSLSRPSLPPPSYKPQGGVAVDRVTCLELDVEEFVLHTLTLFAVTFSAVGESSLRLGMQKVIFSDTREYSLPIPQPTHLLSAELLLLCCLMSSDVG